MGYKNRSIKSLQDELGDSPNDDEARLRWIEFLLKSQPDREDLKKHRDELIARLDPFADPPKDEAEEQAAEAARIDDWLAQDSGAALFGESRPKITTLQELADAREKDFNRRYYGNAEGKADWSNRR